jgi:hypothetical protein
MKKILLFIFTLITFSFAFTQGNNLQYSQSIYLDYTNPSSGVASDTYISSGTFSVPANKTFKITSSSCKQTSGNNPDLYGTSDCSLRINRHNLTENTTLWLPAGTYTVYTLVAGSNWRAAAAITGIEFNIVQ